MSPEERGEIAAELLERLLPLDDTRRSEVAVWLEFTTAARTDPALAELAAAGTHTLVRRILHRAAEAGALRPDLDLPTEVVRLAALIDGLSTTTALQPDLVTPHQCRAALRHHLRDLRR